MPGAPFKRASPANRAREKLSIHLNQYMITFLIHWQIILRGLKTNERPLHLEIEPPVDDSRFSVFLSFWFVWV